MSRLLRQCICNCQLTDTWAADLESNRPASCPGALGGTRPASCPAGLEEGIRPASCLAGLGTRPASFLAGLGIRPASFLAGLGTRPASCLAGSDTPPASCLGGPCLEQPETRQSAAWAWSAPLLKAQCCVRQLAQCQPFAACSCLGGPSLLAAWCLQACSRDQSGRSRPGQPSDPHRPLAPQAPEQVLRSHQNPSPPRHLAGCPVRGLAQQRTCPGHPTHHLAALALAPQQKGPRTLEPVQVLQTDQCLLHARGQGQALLRTSPPSHPQGLSLAGVQGLVQALQVLVPAQRGHTAPRWQLGLLLELGLGRVSRRGQSHHPLPLHRQTGAQGWTASAWHCPSCECACRHHHCQLHGQCLWRGQLGPWTGHWQGREQQAAGSHHCSHHRQVRTGQSTPRRRGWWGLEKCPGSRRMKRMGRLDGREGTR